MEKYYIVIDGSQQGPFTFEILKEKNISNTTLVWTENMENWTEAKNVDKLKNVITNSPPPLPIKIIAPLKVEAEIMKKKDKILSVKTEVLVAKETQTIFKQIIIGLIVGVLSLPFFYFIVYESTKFDDVDVSKYAEIRDSRSSSFDISDFDWKLDLSIAENIIIRKKECTEKSIYSAFITFIVISLLIIVVRYVTIGTKWVKETSKKNI